MGRPRKNRNIEEAPQENNKQEVEVIKGENGRYELDLSNVSSDSIPQDDKVATPVVPTEVSNNTPTKVEETPIDKKLDNKSEVKKDKTVLKNYPFISKPKNPMEKDSSVGNESPSVTGMFDLFDF